MKKLFSFFIMIFPMFALSNQNNIDDMKIDILKCSRTIIDDDKTNLQKLLSVSEFINKTTQYNISLENLELTLKTCKSYIVKRKKIDVFLNFFNFTKSQTNNLAPPLEYPSLVIKGELEKSDISEQAKDIFLRFFNPESYCNTSSLDISAAYGAGGSLGGNITYCQANNGKHWVELDINAAIMVGIGGGIFLGKGAISEHNISKDESSYIYPEYTYKEFLDASMGPRSNNGDDEFEDKEEKTTYVIRDGDAVIFRHKAFGLISAGGLILGKAQGSVQHVIAFDDESFSNNLSLVYEPKLGYGSPFFTFGIGRGFGGRLVDLGTNNKYLLNILSEF